jgi:predicted nucleotidyltransferase
MVKKEITAIVKGYLHKVQASGNPAKFGVIFGSQASGQIHADSDIDLVVVSSHFDGSYTFEEVANLWRIAALVDSRIEPIPCGELEWETSENRQIIAQARREGYKIAA